MKQPPREWIAFLREQYPVGSRIKLREMKDPYHPVAPGTMGTLDHIDDVGTVFVKWDNGSGLGLVVGEDSFTVLPPEAHQLKLYMPMTAELYERNAYGDLEEEPTELDSREAVRYADHIIAALQRERFPNEAERGLMTYYQNDDGLNKKVRSYIVTAEVKNNHLWGVAECLVQGELTQKELAQLKEMITGQMSDGIGEGFEQRGIKVDGDELYAHLWQDSGWSIQTEQECFAPKLAEGLPELCFTTLPGSGALVCLKRGESGYYPSDWDTGDRVKNRELADYNNHRLGVTPEQRKAMERGSMHGWNLPGADPMSYVQQDSPQNGGMQMGGMNLE